MLGYTYDTEQQAIADRLICDTYYGYPKDGCSTLHWVDYNFDGVKYYIIFDESIGELLGNPIEFTINE